jgi:hypothetical protein
MDLRLIQFNNERSRNLGVECLRQKLQNVNTLYSNSRLNAALVNKVFS